MRKTTSLVVVATLLGIAGCVLAGAAIWRDNLRLVMWATMCWALTFAALLVGWNE